MAESTDGSDRQAIERFLATWAPLAALPQGSSLRAAVTRFAAAESQEERIKALEGASIAFKLRRTYEALGILRPDRPSDPHGELLALSRDRIAASLREGNPQDVLNLLQRAFEFGRQQVPRQAEAARTFLLEFWGLSARGPNMKYCIYPNGVPYSGGGKTHEEMAKKFVADGLGSGQPMCGGVIYRIDTLSFTFDVSSTAFRTGIQSEGVRQAILRWIRTTGGDEQRVALRLHGAGA